ncbi:MAG: protease, partial [Methanobacteriota archaeon]
ESSPSNKDLIWSHRWAVLDADPTTPGSQSQTADGVQIYGYTMESEDFVIGTVAHEFGHDLGLPDLYDTDGSSAGAGIWDIMSLGSWNGAPAGSSPAHMSAWSLLRL